MPHACHLGDIIYNSVMIDDIFKTGIYWTDLKLDTKSILKTCISYSKKHNSVKVSNRGGYQSNDLLTDSGYSKIFTSILHHAEEYNKLLGYKNNRTINVAWFNINSYKDYNVEHSHPGCTMSGVFYVSTPKDCGDIQFLAPNYNELELNNSADSMLTPYTFRTYTMPAIENRLYIFPNTLRHAVLPNMNKEEKRVSISFNLQ